MAEPHARLTIALLCTLALLAAAVHATMITGTAYDLDLNILNNTIFELRNLDTGQVQKFVSPDGTYTFDASPGTYQLVATHDPHAAVDPLVIGQEQDIIHDIIIIDDLSDLDTLLADTQEELVSQDLVDQATTPAPASTSWIIALLAACAIGAVALVWYMKGRTTRRGTGKHTQADSSADAPEVEDTTASEADDLKRQVLEYIDSQQGRTTQKDVRRQFNYSEAKISLVLTELEHEGTIKKIKKGRSNIVIRN